MIPTEVTQTSRDIAKSMLSLHKGACSVPRNGHIHLAFCEMQERGEVKIKASGTEGYVDVYGKDFRRQDLV